MATLNYDETDNEVIDPSKFTPVPAGKYDAMIVESDSQSCENAPMDQLLLVWQITSGEYEGRKIYDRINQRQEGTDISALPENYQQAIRIGQKSLNTVFSAVGKRVNDSAELHEIPVVIDVKIRPERTDKKTGKTYPPSNEIRNYLAPGAEEDAPAPTPAKTVAKPGGGKTVAAVATSTPPVNKPWMKKK